MRYGIADEGALVIAHHIDALRALQRGHDKEEAHRRADEILCGLLVGLGYEHVVAAWKKVPKWYA